MNQAKFLREVMVTSIAGVIGIIGFQTTSQAATLSVTTRFLPRQVVVEPGNPGAFRVTLTNDGTLDTFVVRNLNLQLTRVGGSINEVFDPVINRDACTTQGRQGRLNVGSTCQYIVNFQTTDKPDGKLDEWVLRMSHQLFSVDGSQQGATLGGGLITITVPESSSTLSLLAIGIGGAALTLKRKLKSSKSSEKELEKVS